MMNWKKRYSTNRSFIVGKYYKLKPGYPSLTGYDGNSYYIIFEGRKTTWVSNKLRGFEKGQTRKCSAIRNYTDGMSVVFVGITGGMWNYHPEDFIEVNT